MSIFDHNKIILFFPETKENERLMTPPLSLLALSAVLEKEGFEVLIIDARVEDDYFQKIKDNLNKVVFVGICGNKFVNRLSNS